MIPVCEPDIGPEELANVIEAVSSGWVSSSGEFVNKFEYEFASFCGTKFGVATCNGTAALHLALSAIGIGAEDEVIVPNLTFIATSNSVIYTGATPIFVDCDVETWCIDVTKIEQVITERTKAIMPVHIFGHPCDMDPIIRICKRYNLTLIEDAAEAHGAEYKGKRVGSLGDIGCFSFHGIKIITTGEGGMCMTDDPALADKMKILRDHGMSKDKKYCHDYIGFNYRLTNMQAALGVAQLNRIDTLMARKRHIASLYMKLLHGIPGIVPQVEKRWARHAYWVFALLVNDEFPMDRDSLMSELNKNNIEVRNMLVPMSQQPAYKNKGFFNGERSQFKISEAIGKSGMYLPSGVKITDEQIQYICDSIRQISTNNRSN